MQGISKNLVSRAFPESERPDYLTSEEFLKFTPTDDFMSLPGEIERTEFRLVVTHKAWEYTVLERELGAHRDPLRKMLVTVGRLFLGDSRNTILPVMVCMAACRKSEALWLPAVSSKDANLLGLCVLASKLSVWASTALVHGVRQDIHMAV